MDKDLAAASNGSPGESERELLTLAAIAAGMQLTENGVRDYGQWEWLDAQGGGLYRNNANGTQRKWNPLTDDGDALRLAVKLRLGVVVAIGTSYAAHCDALEQLTEPNDLGRDPYAATRRAIVRAAAEIARSAATSPEADGQMKKD